MSVSDIIDQRDRLSFRRIARRLIELEFSNPVASQASQLKYKIVKIIMRQSGAERLSPEIAVIFLPAAGQVTRVLLCGYRLAIIIN